MEVPQINVTSRVVPIVSDRPEFIVNGVNICLVSALKSAGWTICFTLAYLPSPGGARDLYSLLISVLHCAL